LFGSAELFSYVVEVYDPVTNSWSTKATLPFNESSQAHAINGKIFVLENNNLQTYGDLYMYNPVADTCIKKTSIPKEPDTQSPNWAHYFISAATSNVILFSSLSRNGVQEAITYNPEMNSWREIANPPYGLFYTSATSTAGTYAPQKIYALGFANNDVYDPVSDT
jgi:N-acetylneuraminic acid mutarotase